MTVTSTGASATKQALRFSVKSMSNGYAFPDKEWRENQTAFKNYVKSMPRANVLA